MEFYSANLNASYINFSPSPGDGSLNSAGKKEAGKVKIAAIIDKATIIVEVYLYWKTSVVIRRKRLERLVFQQEFYIFKFYHLNR